MHLRALACVVLASALALALGLSAHEAKANNWPPAKGADMTDPNNWPNDPGYQGDWNYWSWLPKQASGTTPYVDADRKLGASGMHVDVAWTHTTGRPDVKIAVIDCGIKWDEADLADKAYLNAGELVNHKPHDQNGNACGGTGALAGYDCNGDGVFSVSDYAADPGVAPVVSDASDVCYVGADPTKPGPPRKIGDVNKNCILDAGDLIGLFSDHIDDDDNGYTDDISGWDFYKNDNDPYDDTRYGHGTGEARGSSGQGNNGIGDIGVCPDCRFMMLRAGDSFIADVNDFAKAAVYATDAGVKVIQEALGTIDQSAFSKAAIDYAYAHGTLVVASMADENSRHHNMPAVANHTLPVHSIKFNGQGVAGTGTGITTDSNTFVDFDLCSNYGAQNMLSISASSCSSQATEETAGAAGLLFSEAMNQKLQLTPEEVMQLLKTTADLIDVPESVSTDPSVSGPFFESLPYFSQRFGYGRPNLDRAMQSVDAGLIPPEVDITAPAWFDVLYADRLTSPVPIVFRVAAKRAQSYDYRVEWAPGVEPADSAFQPILDWVKNVSNTTTTGADATAPLAMINPSQIDTSHVADPDSAHFHENDKTVTLRVLAVAHYANGDVAGQARRAIAIVNQQNGLDEDLAQGFPIAIGSSLESSPKLADIDGDGVRDVVAASSDGSLHVFSVKGGTPAEIPGFPFHVAPLDGLNPNLSSEPSVPSYLSAPAYTKGSKGGGIDPTSARESIVATPAVGDVNGDGKPEIVVSTWQGTIYVVAADGTVLPGWPKRLPLVPSCPHDLLGPTGTVCMDTGRKWSRGAGASPVLADFEHDGKLEIVQAAFDGNLYVWHADGTLRTGFPVLLHGPRANAYNRIFSTPAVADFNGDGVPDIACGSNEEVGAGGGAGLTFLVDGRGMNAPGGPFLPNWPLTLASFQLFPLVGEGIVSAPAIADFTGSNHPQLLWTGNGISPTVVPADPGTEGNGYEPANSLPCYDADAGAQTSCSTPGAQVGIDPTSIFGAGSKARLPDTMLPLFSSPAVGDLDQDGVPDIISSGGSLSLIGNLTGGGSSASRPQFLLGMWSGATGHAFYGSPVPIEDYTFLVNETVADITGDGYPEVMLGTGGYFVHAADACGCEAPSWPKFTDGWIVATPAVGDVDGDHKLEVVTGTRDGYLFAWHTQGTDTGVIQWESLHHDNRNSGDYRFGLDQGTLKVATAPIDCSVDCTLQMGASAPEKLRAGGCGCRAVSADADGEGGWAVALASVLGVGGVALRRRRQDRAGRRGAEGNENENENESESRPS
jgi:hypothetical protein